MARLQAELQLDIAYDIEPERTIPAARNHALRLARGNLIGIIDDDEFPPPEWLLRMYEAVRTFDVDGALGPVVPFYPDGTPRWLVKSGICELPSHDTGALLHWSQTKTGNVLLKKDVFDAHGLSFDSTFRTGGSDQDFFRRAAGKGYRFVAVREAPVYEAVPPARWTRSYWVRRALVNGYNAERYAAATKGILRRTWLCVRSAFAGVIWFAALPACACAGPHRLVLCMERASYHLSRTLATFGVQLWDKRDF